jgi:DNA-binding beta-propeller fold protein YncE
MMKRFLGALASTVPLFFLATGCGETGSYGDDSQDAGSASFTDAGSSMPECFSSNECPTGWTCSEFGTCVPPLPTVTDGGVEQPPEVEYELGAPISSRRFIYVAMPELDSLAKIDGETLAVTSLAVGEEPEVVATAPGSDTAVVLDSKNGTATIIRPTVDQDVKRTFATLPHLNQLVIDPTGKYAVSWFDLNKAIADAGGLDFVTDIGSFQDVTILDLTPGSEGAVDLTVGFRPREVEFDSAGSRAFVITEDGISVIDLAAVIETGPSMVSPIPVTGDPLADPDTIEVDVVSTGGYAIVREAGIAQIRILDLTGDDIGTSWVVPLPAEASDIDLAPDGTRAYAVLREISSLAVIDIPGDALAPEGIEVVDFGEETIGSLIVSRNGATGILFTNAYLAERLTVVDLTAPGFPWITHPLQKSIRHIQFDPTGTKAMVVHAKEFGDPGDADTFDDYIDRCYGYSVFDIGLGFAKLQITPVDPGAFTFPDSAPLAYIILDGGDAEGAVTEVQSIELDTGVVRSIELGSPPSAVGVLPDAGNAFISQRHPLGRVSFIDIASGDIRTITGFDLNSRIVD